MPKPHWYLHVNGQPTGPFLPQDLRRLVAAGQILPNDRLRRRRPEMVSGTAYCRPVRGAIRRRAVGR